MMIDPDNDTRVRALYFDCNGTRIEKPTNAPKPSAPETYEVEISEMVRHVHAVDEWMRNTATA